MKSAKEQLRQVLNEQLIAGQTAAKWMPREKSANGNIAREIREFFGMSPRQYRRQLSEMSETVEQKMCAKDWDNINYSHVPSLAHSRYKKAFTRNGTSYTDYVAKLAKGEAGVKINAGAVFPYDVLKGAIPSYGRSTMSKTELDALTAQWEALPNFIGDASVLPMIDSSGSMTCSAGKNTGLSCLDVALSLGLYFADKNKGKFKDTFLTFSDSPKLVNLKGNIVDKLNQMNTGEVANTNLNKAFDLILKTAIDNNVPQAEMPEALMILSDMNFDGGVDGKDESAIQMMERKYVEAGYKMPSVIFWNLNASDHTPVKFDKRGTALVSGFSPAIAKSILSGNLEDISPEAIMLRTVMTERYNLFSNPGSLNRY